MIFLNNMTLDIVKLLVEFIYKGNISMPESQIENFLDAGRYLQIEGVAGGNQSVHLEDQHVEEEEEEEEDIPENSIMNSTENYESVERLREANPDHLRSFLELSRISGGLERSVRQDVSVNIRRMSKESTDLYLSRCGEVNTSGPQEDVEMVESPANTERSKRRSRTVSVVGEVEEVEIEEVEVEDDDVIECERGNTSRQSNKSRRISRYEDDDEDFVSTGELSSQSSQSQNNSRRSDRLRKCPEKLLSAERNQHGRESHPGGRSSLTSTPHPSRNNSYINLGSLYRTRPMESRRSLMAKTTSDFSRIRKTINKSSLSNGSRTSKAQKTNTERREMMRTLETRPAPVRAPQPSLPSSADDIPLPVLQPSQPGETQQDPLGGEPSASAPVHPEPSAEADSSESAACSAGYERDCSVESNVVTEVVTEVVTDEVSEVVTTNIVNMNGRSMCRVCGMQVILGRSSGKRSFIFFIFRFRTPDLWITSRGNTQICCK